MKLIYKNIEKLKRFLKGTKITFSIEITPSNPMNQEDSELITESWLEQHGFKVIYEAGGVPEKTWVKHAIKIWEFHYDKDGSYWIIDVLDQAGIEVEFHFTHELKRFFTACKLSPEEYL